MLIVFTGPPCSGKSTLAAEVARVRGLPHLSMDATRQRLLPSAAHTRADRQVAYRGMHFAAELLLAAGAGAVLDAPYDHSEDRAELARIAGSQCKLIECHVSPSIAAARLRERGLNDTARPDLTEERVRRLARDYPYSGAGLALDTAAMTPQACLARIDDYLREG
ncbi:MAG: ATP-binding protein [Bryobacteraceae bacterium]